MSERYGPESGRALLFVAAGLMALLAAVPVSIWLSRSPANLGQFDRLSAEIGCLCGTCPLRPIGTCGCGFADGMLARLQSEIEAGRSDDEIMAVFAADYGSSIRIKPGGSGMDLLAWAAPMIFLMVGGVVVAAIISQWRDAHSLAAGTVTPAVDPTDASPEGSAADTAGEEGADDDEAERYRAMVDEELANLDS